MDQEGKTLFGTGDETLLHRDSIPWKQGSSLLLKAWGDCLSEAEGRRGNLYHKSLDPLSQELTKT